MIKLSEIFSFVHNRGKWQTEDCYKTVVARLHKNIVICNQNTYGTKEEQECCYDSIWLKVGNNNKCKLLSVELNTIEQKDLVNSPFYLNLEYYSKYCIEIDM